MKSKQGQRVNISDISKEIDGPLAFTAKILQKLVKADIVNSVKGPHGGFAIPETRLSEITLSEVVEIIDGPNIYFACALGLKECDKNRPCPLHDEFVKVRTELKKVLDNATLEKLALDFKLGTTYLKFDKND